MGCCDIADPADPFAPLPLDAALARLGGDYACVVETESVALKAAAGRILAEDVAAPFDAPPSPVSAMDGYGFVHPGPTGAEGQTTFRIIGRVPAGSMFDGVVGPGEAVRIFTGAPVPAGVDTVVMQEDCCADGDAVTVRVTPKPGANIRPAGEDLAAGRVGLRSGMRLRAQEIGLAAAMGRRSVLARKPLRVVLFSTGDELREPGADKPAWAIYDTNRYAVGAQLTALGCLVEDLGILPDKPEAVRAALAEAATRADLLVTSGGVSVGEEDHVKGVVQSLGRLDMWRLAIRPGKPLALGRVGDAVFLGLPGNPVSAMVTFMLMGRPLVLRLSGAAQRAPARTLAVAGFALKKKAGRREFPRVRLAVGVDGIPTLEKFPNDSSGVLTSMVEADGLADIPAETTEVKPGDLIGFLPFTGLYG
ncbi:MAG TPA: molybdopterin molybdotransferase MoeA [Azospirillaceae bacterium]|nr:molybdopterin molybdotransferase MoeA [Azospirillaceae bacterium]